MPAVPVPNDIEEICALADPVLRNLLITQRYHDLSLALRAVIEGSESEERTSNANWSTFATWASKTAGETIRDEEVPRVAMKAIAEAEEVKKGLGLVVRALEAMHSIDLDVPDLLRPIEKTIHDLSAQIAFGNLKVFRELAPLFAAFVVEVGHATDESAIDRFVGKLADGDAAHGGQDLLKSAFRGYFLARFETDKEKRAQLLLACNCQIGLHEQTRLQPQIAGALDAPIRDLLRDGVHDVAKSLLPFHLHDRIVDVITLPLEPVLSEVARVWRRIATRHLMSLTLPLGDRLPLGEDLRASFGEPLFPPDLRRISGPPDLLELVARFDRGTLVGEDDEHTGALDWSRLSDRMNFILNLFRSRQQEDTLFGPPFEAPTRDSIERRQLPADFS